ncbi:MAG: UTP--glucose-1-phosphate uridylyltransferase, partial [Rhodospirillales bacterium]
CGTKIGFVTANVAFALQRNDLGGDIKAELQKII